MMNTDGFVLRTSLKPLTVFELSLESVELLQNDNVMEIINTAASLLKDCLSFSHMPVLNIKAIKAQLEGNVHLLYYERNLMML